MYLSRVDRRVENLWYDSKCTLRYDSKVSYSGKTSFFPNIITLKEPNEKVFLHELGHLLHGFSGWEGATKELEEIWKEEKSKYSLFNARYVCSSKEEFFAEGYALYELNKVKFKSMCPKLYEYIVKSLNNINIIFVV